MRNTSSLQKAVSFSKRVNSPKLHNLNFSNWPNLKGKFGSIINQGIAIAQHYGYNVDYLNLKRVSFNQYHVLHGDENTGYSLFITTLEID